MTYSRRIVKEAKEELELIFGCELSDEEACRILHEITTIVRIVCKEETR